MSPVSKRTGRRYAQGSHGGWSDGDSRVCAVCGRKLRITKDEVQVHTDDVTGVHTSWHIHCLERKDGAVDLPC